MNETEVATNAQMWAVIVGFLMPLVIGRIVDSKWRAWVKAAIAFGASAIAGVGTAYFAGAFNGLDTVGVALTVVVVSITAYGQFWKKVTPQIDRGAAAKRAAQEEGSA